MGYFNGGGAAGTWVREDETAKICATRFANFLRRKLISPSLTAILCILKGTGKFESHIVACGLLEVKARGAQVIVALFDALLHLAVETVSRVSRLVKELTSLRIMCFGAAE